jgi:hypothetical protein
MPTAVKDVVGALLLVFLLPLWMAAGLGAVLVVVARQLYWWVRGNTSAVSRPSTHETSSPRDYGSTLADTRPAARAPRAAVLVTGQHGVPSGSALSPATGAASER